MDNALVPTTVAQGEVSTGNPRLLNVPECFDNEQSGGLFEYWSIIWRHKGTVILTALLGAFASILITLAQSPTYRARTSIEIQYINNDFMNLKQVNPLAESSTNNIPSDIQTQIKILQSDLLAERTLATLKIETPAGLHLASGRLATWSRLLKLPTFKTAKSHQALLEAFASNLRVNVVGETRLIEVLVDSTDPKTSEECANTLADQYIEQNVEARWQMGQRTGELLGRQLDQMRVQLEHAEDALQAYARGNGLLFTTEKQNVSEEKLRQLQAELSKAEADRVTRQSHYELTRTATPETLPDVLDDTNLRDLKMKMTDLQRQQADLLTTFKGDYSKAKKVRAEISTIDSALARAQKDIVDRINNEYQEAVRRESLLAEAYRSQTHIVTKDAEKSVEYNILNHEAESTRQMYEEMLQRVKESTIASAMSASNVRIIDRATIPEKPYKPSAELNTALGLLGGLLGGIVLVMTRGRSSRTIREPGDATFFAAAPELGVVPRASKDRRLMYVRRTRLTTSVDPHLGSAQIFVSPKDKTFTQRRIQLATWQKDHSIVSEGFRSVLVSIMLTEQNGECPRVLVVTSGNPMEGKTTVASNLAITLAKIGKRVLLIDGDLCKPNLHTIFELENTTGFVDCLRNSAVGQDAAHAFIRETPIPNLSVLTSGPSSDVIAELIFSTHLSSLIGQWKELYEMVIIDTPPMLWRPDARVLGRMSDAVLLVTRAGSTTRESVVAAQQRFAEDRTRVLGTILNAWDPRNSKYGYYRHNGSA